MSKKEEGYRVDCKVVEKLPNAMFRVELENGNVVLAYSSGKIRQHKISIVVGDIVVVEFSMYDPNRGRIVTRKPGNSNQNNSSGNKA